MKNLLMLAFLTVLFTQIQESVFAQKGLEPAIVILNDGDTLQGFIEVRHTTENAKYCGFRTPLIDSQQEEYTPEDIKGYVINDTKYYASKEVNRNGVREQLFLEYLVKGYANLYYLKEEDGESFFVEKNGEFTELTNSKKVINSDNGLTYMQESNKYKGTLMYLFSDAPEMKNSLQAMKFDTNSMIKATKNYHNAVCDDYACIDYTKSMKKKTWLEPVIGYQFHVLNTNRNESKKDGTALLGLNFRLKNSFDSYQGSFIVGLHYFSNSFSGEYVGLDSRDKTMSYSYDALKILVGGEYSFLPGKIQPYMRLTLNYTRLSNPNVLIQSVSENPLVYDENLELDVQKSQHGVNLNLGVKIYHSSESYLALSFDLGLQRSFHLFNYLERSKQLVYGMTVGYGINLSKNN
ncbi:hypothetical protein [Reichenbachiella versicolor]|uniref:hypothetical protein n=1 Tax=Reichenbachiella versicolor TaxID=1821036 RepID=UPI0013A5381C|nr:hypothetical protein [Reichenbachiella versicolor]